MPTLHQLATDLSTALQALYEVPEAEAMAAQVLEHLLDLTPLHRRMRAAEEVGADERLAALPGIQVRLLCHEPLQYVLGTAHFAGLELEVTPATLIPRPETEELVELIAREQRGRSGLRVLDVGTGSGCIPLALAERLPGAQFTAVDVSAEALAVARRNAVRCGVAVDFQQVDILQASPRLAGPLDVLVSNPPYVMENERPLMRPNVLAYEPATALFVLNHDPLLFYRRIAQLGQELLAVGGVLYFEINEQFAAETEELLRELGYAAVASHQDIFDRPRLVRATWEGKVF
ncbi:peptide chain release factor N(5)-glutamine methyltransferase [Hymenobacter lapidiphilus]|uniref:peptide chain release factor N(5)-glutamine methyltransferase n=1 Tax=Hymenobacter sp. CCM 8763 TaxID=2303334 RepID=UPI000E341A0F|nr:peptide chain release factor N(5)-glutamine methyltransferase [Hymenobacter sp. CCM 8763]RFP66802.1 peptide chain release factor N(5)-glutamine methyltransferase [Hymenobacter sp. CCM 8763]